MSLEFVSDHCRMFGRSDCLLKRAKKRRAKKRGRFPMLYVELLKKTGTLPFAEENRDASLCYTLLWNFALTGQFC
jgi:hypothetical protein